LILKEEKTLIGVTITGVDMVVGFAIEMGIYRIDAMTEIWAEIVVIPLQIRIQVTKHQTI
jgi:hypothetical protein